MRKIIWQKWVNPLNLDGEKDLETEDEEIEEEDDSEEETDEDNEDEDEVEEDGPHTLKMQSYIFTQFGPIPSGLCMDISKHFNYWIGHTNFNITKDVAETINRCPGVEIFDLFSPYRFRIAVGLAFDDAYVRNLIDFILVTSVNNMMKQGEFLQNEEVSDIVKGFNEQCANSKFWLLYLLPNGKTEFFGTEDEKEFEETKKLYVTTKDLTGGLLLSSDDQSSI